MAELKLKTKQKHKHTKKATHKPLNSCLKKQFTFVTAA